MPPALGKLLLRRIDRLAANARKVLSLVDAELLRRQVRVAAAKQSKVKAQPESPAGPQAQPESPLEVLFFPALQLARKSPLQARCHSSNSRPWNLKPRVLGGSRLTKES